jgi:hypothetical protein
VLRWQARAVIGRLDDAKPGPEVPLHALLGWEREAIVKLAEDWGEVTGCTSLSPAADHPPPLLVSGPMIS